MNKIKDFLYDKSDILIALAILLIAALIIGWRLAAIVEYPKELIDNNNNSTEYTEDKTDAPADEPKEEPEEPEVTPSNDSPYGDNGLLTSDVTVNFEGSSATALIQCAVDQGLFEDFDDFANTCLNNGITDPDQIPTVGKVTFAEGSSKLEVAQRIKGI